MKSSSPAVRWTVYAVVAALFAVVCGILSHWQFSRNEERAAMIALVEANYDAEPVPVEQLIDGVDGFDAADEWRPVVLRGEYLTDEQLIVRNRAQGGTAAFEVLVPLRLDDGRIFVVDRGWVPPGDESEPEFVPAAPGGEVTVIARLRPGEPLPSSGRTAPEGQLPTLHLPSVAAAAGEETITAAYGIMVSEDPAPTDRPGELTPPTEDPGPHLSYAIQWILFAVMGFGFIGYIIRTEIAAKREEALDPDEDEDDELPPTARAHRPARAKRRDRDAEEEDALLDA
ncbi:SURF1 family protein [Microbacterium sp. Marseille-Q6965]|uniref:SURF1 family cytochrome oxidase biogenesis protein n=1 Tax=Microbacterium sp. Marseille-Q6965 TaxID=2965072 RepID=UPI0021B7F507|nr:SURF1 family protein [Microbacterium sp. Marseille-Q6965]